MSGSQKRHITELALEMILKRGVRNFRVDDLSHEAGISKRTLYEIFKDKEDVIRYASMLFFEKEEAEYNNIGSRAPNFIESLLHVLEHVSNKAQDTWRLRDDLKKYYNALHVEVTSIVMKRRLESLLVLFNIGVEQGYVRADLDLRLSVVTMQHLFKAMADHDEEIGASTLLDRRAAGHQIISCYFRGLCTIKGAEIMDEYMRIKV